MVIIIRRPLLQRCFRMFSISMEEAESRPKNVKISAMNDTDL